MRKTQRLQQETKALYAYWKALSRLPVPPLAEQRLEYGRKPLQYALWQQPARPDPSLKAVFFHGGAWTFGSPERFRHHGHFFVRQNLDCILPSVRRLPIHYGKHIREDLIGLLHLLDRQFGSSVRWIFGGVSSGGHLSALAATEPSLLASAGWDSSRLAGLLLIAPPLALQEMPALVPFALERGKTEEEMPSLNPIDFVEEAPELDVLLLQGSQDPVVPPAAIYPWIRIRHRLYPSRTQWEEWPDMGHMDLVRWSFPNGVMEPILIDWIARIREKTASNNHR